MKYYYPTIVWFIRREGTFTRYTPPSGCREGTFNWERDVALSTRNLQYTASAVGRGEH